MKHKISAATGCLLLALLCHGGIAEAEEMVPCLVFSGHSPTETVIDLSKINRITFGEDSMKLSSSQNPDEDEIELLYNLFHHLEIKDATPDFTTDIEEISVYAEATLVYLSDINSLLIDDSAEHLYNVGIFDLNGSLLRTFHTNGGTSVSLESLQQGIYIAVATDGTHHLKLKFIQN